MPEMLCDQLVYAKHKLFCQHSVFVCSSNHITNKNFYLFCHTISPEKTTADCVCVVRWRRIPLAASMLEQLAL